ncbi:NfeD family protein, partial [Klebsiella pneumoniae]|uniref:NfeD family protein n=1 Tax=Klebsiella pneumoniae TaxID=573 RepID=UPI003013D308
AGIMSFALRAQRSPVQSGVQTLVGRRGLAKNEISPNGQVLVGSELWSAEAVEGSGQIHQGESVEVVDVKGLRLRVRKV